MSRQINTYSHVYTIMYMYNQIQSEIQRNEPSEPVKNNVM